MSEAVLKHEIYAFRKEDSLVVFFALYAVKSKLDQQLDMRAKTIINLNRIENVFYDELAMNGKMRDVLRDSFRTSQAFLKQTQREIVIDWKSVKIFNTDRMTLEQFELKTNMAEERGGGSAPDRSLHIADESALLSHKGKHSKHQQQSTTMATTTTTVKTSNIVTRSKEAHNINQSMSPYLNWRNVVTLTGSDKHSAR